MRISPVTSKGPGGPEDAATRLLAWYDRYARRLPWRAGPGEKADPYRVWLSEIMLQQTTVAAVGPYFEAFLARWPSVEALAGAPLEEVLAAWAGLGYYARARNLHACAKAVTELHGGRFPDSEEALQSLPGVGPYTAAAIAAIAFNRVASPVDGNIERVVARLFGLEQPLPAVKSEIKRQAVALTPPDRPGDFAQAMMDLGATICQPRKPKCLLCPLQPLCRADALGIAEGLPRKLAKPPKPTRLGVAFWLTRPDGAVLLRRRPPRGLLGGMMEVPSTDWRPAGWSEGEALSWAPHPAAWSALPGVVRHTFTHFHLEMAVWRANVPGGSALAAEKGRWVAFDDLGAVGLPSIMRKIVSHALGG